MSYILSDIADKVEPLNKELAGCLKYIAIKKEKKKERWQELIVTRLKRRTGTLTRGKMLYHYILISG